METFNQAAASQQDPSRVVCRLLSAEEAARSLMLAPVATILTADAEYGVTDRASLHIKLRNASAWVPALGHGLAYDRYMGELWGSLAAAGKCGRLDAWRLILDLQPEEARIRVHVRKLGGKGVDWRGGDGRSALDVARELAGACCEHESEIRKAHPSIVDALVWEDEVAAAAEGAERATRLGIPFCPFLRVVCGWRMSQLDQRGSGAGEIGNAFIFGVWLSCAPDSVVPLSLPHMPLSERDLSSSLSAVRVLCVHVCARARMPVGYNHQHFNTHGRGFMSAARCLARALVPLESLPALHPTQTRVRASQEGWETGDGCVGSLAVFELPETRVTFNTEDKEMLEREQCVEHDGTEDVPPAPLDPPAPSDLQSALSTAPVDRWPPPPQGTASVCKSRTARASMQRSCAWITRRQERGGTEGSCVLCLATRARLAASFSIVCLGCRRAYGCQPLGLVWVSAPRSRAPSNIRLCPLGLIPPAAFPFVRCGVIQRQLAIDGRASLVPRCTACLHMPGILGPKPQLLMPHHVL
jgi:hypothetical protein